MKEISKIKPSKFLLAQNYPNPFKSETRIKYCLAFKARVILTIYDKAGQKLKTLVNRNQEAGTYEINFDGSKLDKGFYYYKIRTYYRIDGVYPIGINQNDKNNEESTMERIFTKTKEMYLI